MTVLHPFPRNCPRNWSNTCPGWLGEALKSRRNCTDEVPTMPGSGVATGLTQASKKDAPCVTDDAHPNSVEGGDNYMLKLFINMKLAIARLMDQEEGQGLTEYALILALIAIVAIVALNFLGGKVNDALSTVGNSLNV